ncbi:MAG: FecR domain-containing protein [Xanthomonadaceae bacterium]|nr:FecR domain-containing protein [Xanthomonadaceae bacterium]
MLLVLGTCTLIAATATTLRAQQYDNSQPYAQAQPYDNADQSPGRVARLAYLDGQVQFAPAGENDWGSVDLNRPMVIGDRLLTGSDGRAVLQLGDSSVRIDHDSAFDFLNLAQDNVQIELSQGTLNLAVRQLNQGANFEVDTPTVAFVASTPGVYRIDDSPSGVGSMVTVFQGSGTVYGENGASQPVVAGTSYRFNDSTLASVETSGLPPADGFDRFCAGRDTNYRRYAQQQQYVPPDTIGGDDLYQYGEWNDTPDYGNVWYPNSVPVGWAPYRYGHWAWIDPWGWTWVDNEPWGFAPFHYGRWVYVSNRWGWIPGPVDVRPVYAPALVAFIGGSGFSLSLNIGGGGPVGWFPLGPRDVYMPWFHASRRYFTNVNVTNIRNVYVNQTVINNFYGDYRRGRVPPRGGHDYAYRRMPGAVTAVPRNVFTGARPVHAALVRLDRTQLARTEVALRPGVNPSTASLGLRRPTTRPTALGGREPFARPVIARHQPPPRPVGFAARERLIANQHGQPLTPAQVQDLRRTQPANGSRDTRVRVIPALAGAAAGAAALNAMRHGATPPRPSGLQARPAPSAPGRAGPGQPPFRNTAHPIPTPQNQARSAPRQPNELPSARFAHPNRPATLPRVPEIRPANPAQRVPPARTRLPEARPVDRAPQPSNGRFQPQQQTNAQAQQRAREQQVQQQRQAQMQAQQRAREQQMQQQRQAEMQAQQRAREQQMQQQRQAQMQAQQRAREQQMQQQRQAQMQAQQRAREQQMQQQRAMEMQRQQQMQQQRAMQMQQQRAMEMQRQQQMRQVPQPRNDRGPVQREPPPRKHPPESSGRPVR